MVVGSGCSLVDVAADVEAGVSVGEVVDAGLDTGSEAERRCYTPPRT